LTIEKYYKFPIQKNLLFKYSLIPYLDPSYPKPDSLTPPNGASIVDIKLSLAPIKPTSKRSATRQI
jgi:hypothetical protein